MTRHDDAAQNPEPSLDPEDPGGNPYPVCQSCQRMTTVGWHCTQVDVFDLAACSTTHGDGVWLCGVCHRSVHEHMDTHPDPGCAAVSLLRLTERLARIVGKKPRPYQRRPFGHGANGDRRDEHQPGQEGP